MVTFALKIPSSRNKNHSKGRKERPIRPDVLSYKHHDGLAAEGLFIRMLSLERMRSERSRKPFLLMLLHAEELLQTNGTNKILQKIVSALSCSTRETDVKGWYKEHSVLGVIFTEIGSPDKNSIVNKVLAKTRTALQSKLEPQQVDQIQTSFYFFPEDWDTQNSEPPVNSAVYPDLLRREESRKLSRYVKRAMDIVGSVLALIVFSPLFILISLAIRLSSKGPIFFRQARVGQYGATFTFLKFRSMHCVNDANVHKEFVKRFIAGNTDSERSPGCQNGVYKITNDPRVTRMGEFLRKTSLDELPQFWNVLKGEMSLVGPRPPIPYEIESYDIWHRRRLLEVKPGITGLWQVNGRSRTTFDDMVRLDLKYAKTWSPWLDVKLLLQTPRAVLKREGAY